MLADSRPVALLTQMSLAQFLPPVSIPLYVLVLDAPAHAEAVAAHDAHNPEPAQTGLAARHLAYVIYTSGSTGLPKGVRTSTTACATWRWRRRAPSRSTPRPGCCSSPRSALTRACRKS